MWLGPTWGGISKRRSLWLLCVGLAIVACLAVVRAPEPQRMGQLGPPAASSTDAFSVVYFGPQGAAATNAVITVVFSHPIVELTTRGELPEDFPTPSVQPALEGRWVAVGSSSLQFHPTRTRLPAATRFSVEIPAIPSLEGHKLPAAQRFEFTTPLPRVVNHSPVEGAEGLATDTAVRLQFNQRVRADSVQSAARLLAGGRSLAFRVLPVEDDPQALMVQAQDVLPRNAAIELQLSAGVRSEEGPQPSTKPFSLRFSTYGPLQVSLQCGWDGCLPQSELVLRFSNPVRLADVKRRLSCTPNANLRWYDWFDETQFVREATVGVRLEPRAQYSCQLSPGLRDEFGQLYSSTEPFRFVVSDYPPDLRVGIDGTYLDPRGSRQLTLRSRNVSDYEVVTALAPADYVAQIAYGSGSTPAVGTLSGAHRRYFRGGPPNALHDRTLELDSLFRASGANRSGAPLALQVLFTGTDGTPRERRHLIQVTDLALSAKLGPEGSLLWVTRLSTGKPQPNARVELWEGARRLVAREADATGVVRLSAQEYTPELMPREARRSFVVRHGDETLMAAETAHLGVWRMPFPPALYEQRYRVQLFTDRGVYRPGHEVWVKGIVRRESRVGAAAVVKHLPLRVHLKSPAGSESGVHTVDTNEFGSFALRFAIPASAELGYWTIEVEGEALRETISVRVAEYEPVEFEVTARVNAPSFVNGQSAHFDTTARYLFGAPVAAGELRYHVSYQKTHFKPAQTEGFVTEDRAYWVDRRSSNPTAGQLASGNTALDAQGQHDLALPLEVPNPMGPMLVRFDAEVSDVSRRSVSASAATLLHPADHYVGIEQLESSLVQAPHRLLPRVVAFKPDGTRVAPRNVELELLRRRWTSVRQHQGSGYRQVHQWVDESVDRCVVQTRDKPAGCPLRLSEAGYYIVRATSTDAQQRQTSSSLALYALGEGRISWRDDAATHLIQLQPDKQRYRVGDTAKVLIQSPFAEANALITVERAGVLEHRVVTLQGASPTIDVPIEQAYGSNVYVSVHVLRPKRAGVELAEHELYRVGYAELQIDSAERRLSVELTSPTRELQPGQQASVDVQVRDHGGHPARAEVTFFAVDEGVLQLTGYQLPDPGEVFTQPRPLRVVTLESRADLARLFTPTDLLLHDKGSEGGGGGDARSNFVQTAHFEPSVVTDENGRARITFTLGDNLTTYRLMAVAVSDDDRYGSAADRLTASKPLMARPALPRFLRAGDELEAALIVSTRDFEAGDVEVHLEAAGVVATGATRQRVRVSATGTREVRFPVRAPAAGAAKLRFTVRTPNGSHSDRVEVQRTIRSPATLETVAAYGEVETAEGQRLGALDRVRSDVGGLEIALSPTRLVGLDASLESLTDYPYACTEQLASRLLPELPLRELALAFGLELKAQAAPDPDLVRQLLERQHASGGFGFWEASSRADPWVSAYTLWVLRLAQRSGLRLSESVFERGAEFLRHELTRVTQEQKAAPTPTAADAAVDLQAFIAFVLAELGQPRPALIERLLESLERSSVEATAWLALAAHATEAPGAVTKPLLARLESFVVMDGNRATVQAEPNERQRVYLLASRTRSQALVLYALLALNPQHRLGPALAHDLLARRTDGVWRTTQESAFSLLALERYWHLRERDPGAVTARVWLGEQALLTERFEGREVFAHVHHIEMARLLEASSFDLVVEAAQRASRSPLFYEARLRYAPRDLPAHPLDRGLSVLKLVRTVPTSKLADAVSQSPLVALSNPSASIATAASERAPSAAALVQQVLPADELVLVDVLVATAVTRHHVVIDDPLPAGLEAVDFELATTSEALRDAVVQAPPLQGFATTWSDRELRDDRVLHMTDELAPGLYRFQYLARPTTLGRFVVPPTRAFEMYQPEVSGRTGASLAWVRESRAVSP